MLTEPDLERQLQAAVSDYFDGCRGRVDGFIAGHFQLPGAWRTNRPAFGPDLLRAPLNLFWAPVYVLATLVSLLAARLRWRRVSALLRQLPAGLTTDVQAHISALIYRDLLCRGDAGGQADRLQDALVVACKGILAAGDDSPRVAGELEPVIADALEQYGLARTASADITNSALSTVVGAFAFQKFTPGGLAVGFLLASWLAEKQAVSSFYLGEFFGSLYYALVPVQPSLGFNVLGVGLVLACLAVFASFSGVVTDPVQSRAGIHRRRLNKMIDHLQRDFEANSGNTFQPKDAYLARILEIMDAAKSQLV